MATTRLVVISDQQTHDWTVSNKGEMLGDLWSTRNIDLESSRGKVRLAERIAILQDGATDQTKWGTTQYPRGFIRSNADGTDKWWAMVGDKNYANGGSPMWVTSSTDPTVTWAQDAIVLSPSAATDSMEVFLQDSGNFDRLIVPDGSGDLSMCNSGNVRTFNISSSTDATPIQVTMTVSGTDSGIFTGNKVTIAGHTTNTNANGTWTITRVSAFVLTLNGSTATGAGAGPNTGTVASSAWKTKWWTGNLGQTVLSSTNPIVLKKFNVNKLLLIGEGRYVHTIDSTLGDITSGSGSTSVSYRRLIFPTGYVINAIVATPDYAWFFLCNIISGDAIAARWDGGETTYENPIPLYDPTVYSAIIKDGIPHCINGKGQLLAYNGQAFSELDVLPSFYDKQIWSDGQNILTNPYGSVLHRNGMAIVDGMIHVLLKATMNNDQFNRTYLENFSSGVWVYNPKSGFYCKYTIGQYRSTDIEWGAKAIVQVGALVSTDIAHGRFLMGAIVFTDETLQNAVMLYSKVGSSTLNRGQIVTSQIHIPALEGMYVHTQVVRAIWKSISYSFEKFANSTDRLIIKIRTNHSPTRSYKQTTTCHWVTGGQSFTAAASGWNASAIVGDEVEIYLGQSAGATAHITSISLNGGTYTIGIDEAFSNVTNGSLFECYTNNWLKITTINVQTIEENVSNIMRNASWVQVKVELRGSSTSPELKDMTLNYEPLQR